MVLSGGGWRKTNTSANAPNSMISLLSGKMVRPGCQGYRRRYLWAKTFYMSVSGKKATIGWSTMSFTRMRNPVKDSPNVLPCRVWRAIKNMILRQAIPIQRFTTLVVIPMVRRKWWKWNCRSRAQPVRKYSSMILLILKLKEGVLAETRLPNILYERLISSRPVLQP